MEFDVTANAAAPAPASNPLFRNDRLPSGPSLAGSSDIFLAPFWWTVVLS
jgi:hypothetical protein